MQSDTSTPTTVERGSNSRLGLRGAWPWVIVGLVSSIPATAYAVSCFWWELWELRDPKVELIDGDGEVEQERARWENLSFRQFDGPHEIVLGEEVFVLEKAP